MVIISTAVDDADLLAAAVANGTCAPRQPAASDDPAAAGASLFDVVHGTTAADVGAGTTTAWWSSQTPNYAASTTATSSGAYASSSLPPPPLESHGDDLGCYAGSIMDALFPQPPVHMQSPSMAAEPSYFYHPQPQGFPPCFAAPFALEPATTAVRPELQLPATMTQPASVPPSLYPQAQGRTTAPALADTQQAQEDTRRSSTPRRRGRPPKRAPTVSASEPPVFKTSKRVASTSQRTSSAAATGSATMMSSSSGQVPVQRPDQTGASSSSTGSTSGQETAACTSTNHPMAVLFEERRRCQLQPPAFSNGAVPAAADVVVEGHHQQAATAIAPPELTMVTTTTGPRYADTSAVGVRFHPTDQQLIGYLRMKHARQPMPVKFFKEFDVYHAHPMAIRGACGESQDGCWYAFSPRDRKYRNGRRPARSVFAEGGGGEQVGFWKSNSKLGAVRAGGRKDGAVIGRMTSLTFQLGRQPRGRQTGWKMKEYTIPENQHQPDGSAMLLNDWVVCKLFYKERRPRCPTDTESKTDGNATSVGQERPVRGKSEKDRDAISVGQKRPRRSSRNGKKDKNAIPVAVGQEDVPGEAAGESMHGEEDMQQMVPAAHQASDCSEQDLCVEDYLVCDVAFAQQNDAANCTI